jgi:uncharacterized repeat protein (TIGR01451 family)
VTNTATATVDGETSEEDAVTVTADQNPEVGVSKSASAPVANGDGTYDVTYTITTENTGNIPLSDLQLTDDLTEASQLGPAFVAVKSAPQIVLINVSLQAEAPTLNGGYDGGVTNANMLIGIDGLLMPGDGYVVTLTVTIDPNAAGAPEVLANLATGLGTGSNSVRVRDLSDNGNNPAIQPGGPGLPTVIVIPTGSNADVTLTKVASVRLAKRGDVVAYTITAKNNLAGATGNITIVDKLPAGFIYVDGSAEIDGAPVTPTVAGSSITFTGVNIPGNGQVVITILVKISASVEPGDHTNMVDAVNPVTGDKIATRATATVRIDIEHVFDCGEIIGKVFDDVNRNGYQDEGEPGMPGVRLATVRGVLITTDRYGRFSVPCADIPDARIGSNFILKLDTRTLPTGYRLTTENPRAVRLTAGKVTKLNFGVAIDRVVRIDLNNAAFAANSAEPSRQLRAGIDKLIATLDQEHSVVRLTYYATVADQKLAQKRLKAVNDLLKRAWRDARGSYELGIETKVIRK